MPGRDRPVVGIAAWSGTGKTTLLCRMLPVFSARSLRVGVVKHTHHDIEVDQPGKDSHALRKAGATQVLLGSPRRWALMAEMPEPSRSPLAFHLGHLDSEALDLVLVEGFRLESLPKIELHRPSLGRPLLCVDDDNVIAVATDGPLPEVPRVPVLDLNRPDVIAGFIVDRFLSHGHTGP